jgi:hypothetical protein
VDLASSNIGSIRFASLHFGSLSQLLKAFLFLLNVGRIMIHLYPKDCYMSHEMAISVQRFRFPGPFEQVSIDRRMVALSRSRFLLRIAKMVCGRRGNEGKMPSSGRNTVETGTDESRGSSVYSSASNKLNFVFRNEYFEPLKCGF